MSAREKWRKWFDGPNGPFADSPEFADLTPGEAVSLAAWLAAKADDAEICDARVDAANANVKAWTFNGGREAAAMVERYYAAEARACAAAIRSSDAIGGR